MANGIFKKLQKDLKLFLKKSSQDSKQSVLPGFVDDKDGKLKPLSFLKNPKGSGDFNNEFKRIWDWWIEHNNDHPSSFRNRRNRYNDLSYSYYNSAIFSAGVELLADETVQPDSQDEYITVYASNLKFQKTIEDFFNKIGLTQPLLRSIAYDIGLYGDSFLMNSVSMDGVSKIIEQTPYVVTDRIEFSLHRAIELYNQQRGNTFNNILNKNNAIKDLLDYYRSNSENHDITELFESYLFGYILGDDLVVPPWAVTHFRRFSSESEFFPFGKPAFMHAISPYRQYTSAMTLQEMARVASFPIKHFKVKVEDNMTEAEQFNAVNEAMLEYKNIGLINSGKDEFTINDELWTPQDLLEVDIISNSIRLDDVADLEMLQNQFLTAMKIPKGYIPIGDDNGWGTSGKSLTQQSKMFGRMVYVNQQAILEGLTYLVKLHFTLTGEFEGEEFELTMPFPEIEEDSDRQRMKSDSLRLANDIISNFSQSLGLDRGEALPISIVQDIFSHYSFLDEDEIDNWINIYLKNKEDETTIEESSKGLNIEKIKERYTRLKEEEKDKTLRELYFDSKKRISLKEGTLGKRHYMNSWNSFHPSQQRILDFMELLSNKKTKGKIQEDIEKLNEVIRDIPKTVVDKIDSSMLNDNPSSLLFISEEDRQKLKKKKIKTKGR